MIGRGTRKCDNLFGPDKHKECFYIFDCCDNFPYFEENEKGMEAKTVLPLSQRIFRERLFLAERLKDLEEAEDAKLRSSLYKHLHEYVSGMCHENFLVRPHLRLVSKLADSKAWFNLDEDARAAISKDISALPSAADLDDEYAKRWDYLLLKTQASLLDKDRSYERLIKRIIETAKKLEDKTTIPDVKKQLTFIQQLQEKLFWEGMNLKMLEEIRKRLRLLVKYIDTKDKKIVYTDFEDELDQPSVFEPGTEAFGSNDLAAYQQKMAAILKANEDKEVIWKIRCNRPLSDADLKQIDEILELSTPEDKKMFKESFTEKCASKTGNENPTLEMLIRSIVGLDREAVEKEFSDFLDKTRLTSQQQAFVRKVIDYFVQDGFVPSGVLYEAPFDAYDDLGPDHLFGEHVEALFAKLEDLNGVQESANR
jgi:type I restriction enzyme R subunit